jgi:hypothetical protein
VLHVSNMCDDILRQWLPTALQDMSAQECTDILLGD